MYKWRFALAGGVLMIFLVAGLHPFSPNCFPVVGSLNSAINCNSYWGSVLGATFGGLLAGEIVGEFADELLDRLRALSKQ